MTLKIPKVPVNRPGSDEIIWVDIYTKLFMDRIIFLSGVIEMKIADQMIGLLLFLGVDDDDIYIYINSTGGKAPAGISIYNTIQTRIPDVCTSAIGFTASTASLILAGGTRYRRKAFPNARIMIHQPVIGRLYEPPRMLHAEAGRMYYSRNKVAEIYSQNTGKPINIIQDDMERDRYMSAAEAKDYGIIDHIVEKRKKENL
uniref:clp protease proteolytic subunit n=1 Tax=Juncus grisebachii TaxID=2919638 RepID=UPI001F1440A9|nr:clp protease proteolytic subunit [Juncus grisebachii]ULQ66860.1 clp protease proteolytic subunit [Juncus grisebachii]